MARAIIIVAATATTGVYSTRISSQMRTGSVLTLRTGEKYRKHHLVEGGDEGENAAAQHARHDRRQRHRAKGAQRTGAEPARRRASRGSSAATDTLMFNMT